MSITALPTPPSRQDPTNFNDRADAFLGALPQFVTEANNQASEVNTASANAVAANQAVIAATNITKWVSGNTYAEGAVVWSPINALAYRRITASGSGTTDPSLDSTNYKQVNGTGDVSTSGNQTIAGVKTFSNEISASSGIAATYVQTSSFYLNSAGTVNFTPGEVTVFTQSTSDNSSKAASTAYVNNKVPSMLNASGSAPMYAARAWVNFNGTGTVAIRSSGNVSSITDNGIGDYTVNFSTAMPDANYAFIGSSRSTTDTTSGYSPSMYPFLSDAKTTVAIRLRAYTTSQTLQDSSECNVVIFR